MSFKTKIHVVKGGKKQRYLKLNTNMAVIRDGETWEKSKSSCRKIELIEIKYIHINNK